MEAVFEKVKNDKAQLGYEFYYEKLINKKDYEHYLESSETILGLDIEKYKVTTGIMWDDDSEKDIRVIIKVKKPTFMFFGSSKTGGFVIKKDNSLLNENCT